MRHLGEYSGMGEGKNIVHTSYETGKLSYTHTSTHFCMQSSLQDVRHSLICYFLPAWNHVMEMDAVSNNKTSCEPNLIMFIQSVKHHTPQSANITWPNNITCKKKFNCKIANIIVAEENKTFLDIVKKITWIHSCSNGVGHNLTCQVNLNARVNCSHFWVLGYNTCIIYIHNITHLCNTSKCLFAVNNHEVYKRRNEFQQQDTRHKGRLGQHTICLHNLR